MLDRIAAKEGHAAVEITNVSLTYEINVISNLAGRHAQDLRAYSLLCFESKITRLYSVGKKHVYDFRMVSNFPALPSFSFVTVQKKLCGVLYSEAVHWDANTVSKYVTSHHIKSK